MAAVAAFLLLFSLLLLVGYEPALVVVVLLFAAPGQGCLSGYFWSPPGSRETSRHERGSLYYNNWLFDPPYWLKGRASFWRLLGLATFFTLFPAVFVPDSRAALRGKSLSPLALSTLRGIRP